MKNPGPFILIILSLALFFTFTNPQYKKIQDIKAIETQYDDILNSIDDIKAKRDSLLLDYEKIDPEEIERMFKALPETVDSVHLALDLEKMAAKYGVAITSVSVNKQSLDQVAFPDSSPYEKARVTIAFVSNYINLQNLLTDMEKSLRILDIKSIKFATTETGLYQYNITLDTYWHKK